MSVLVRDSQALTDPSPAVGDIQFTDNYLPPVQDGILCTITMNQTLQSVSTPPPHKAALNQPFSANQQFVVSGPRFQFPGTDIQAMYPPDKSQGQFEQQLPYIVLTKRALPWERKLSVTAAPTTPWLALLLFQEDEIYLASDNNGSLANPTKASTYTVVQITQNEAGILKPAITLDPILDDPDTLCRAIDITPTTFLAVVPHDDELPYLAHCRNVNLTNKEDGLVGGSGWFSTVMANRLPQNTSQQPIKYIAHLVSLEGFSTYIQANQPTPIPAGINYVRLVSLASWTFTCLPQPQEDFATLLLNLVQNQAQGGAGLLLQMPASTIANPSPDQQLAQKILSRGYLPLSSHVQSGEQTYAWYRGPLTPVPIERFTNMPPYPVAEAALIYDQETGVFDQSYAVAWQTGRLLALADRALAISMLNWRQQGNQTVNLLYHRLKSPYIATELKQTDTVARLRSLLHPKQISESFMTFLANDFSDHSKAHVAALGTERVHSFKINQNNPRKYHAAATRSSNLINELKQFMQRPDMPSLLPKAMVARLQASGVAVSDDPTNAIPADIVTWLTNLCLLKGVPFNQLVPNQAMLPAESIRFFYVDPNFLDGLVDGALSIGIQSSRDSLFTQIMRSHVHAAVLQTLPKIRRRLMGTQLSDTDGFDPNLPIAGFLLRSAAIAGWPGLEIKIYSDSAGTKLLQPMRIERLTPDILLCLGFTPPPDLPNPPAPPVSPARIEFDEPHEGLRFGVEDSNLIYLRSIQGTNPGSQLPGDPTITAPLRNSAFGVLDIGQLSSQIQQGLEKANQLPAGTTLSPSQFVIQLVRAPEQMVFQNQG